MTKEKAIELAKTNWWKESCPEAIVSFQLFEELLCMDFADFRKAVEQVLGRPVFTHEFAYPKELQKEFLKEKPKPTFEDILNLIPEHIKVFMVNANE